MLKELQMEDMIYLDNVIAEVFGHHAMIYKPEDRYCHIANPISFDGKHILAIGIEEDSSDLSIKVINEDGEIAIVNAIEI